MIKILFKTILFVLFSAILFAASSFFAYISCFLLIDAIEVSNSIVPYSEFSGSTKAYTMKMSLYSGIILSLISVVVTFFAILIKAWGAAFKILLTSPEPQTDPKPLKIKKFTGNNNPVRS
jgi:hypothetical protein